MKTCKIKIKKLTDTARIPEKAHPEDTGYDLFVDRFEDMDDKIKIYTGIAIEPEEGWYVEIAPRSSIHKTGMILSNSIGIIDYLYRGEIMGIFYKNLSFDNIKIGDRLLQMYPRELHQIHFEEVSELSDTSRGSGGYGSSGK